MTSPHPLVPENQQQRWVKYGANVVLVSVVVIALAVLVIYLAQSSPHRIDTTSSGMYSLKPQTINIIKENKQPITIISLYTRTKAPQSPDSTAADETDSSAPAIDQAGVVADLLEEYRTRGSNITTEEIDPVTNTAKVEDLIDQISNQYGGEISKYKAFAAELPDKYKTISKLADAELDKIKALPLSDIQSEDVADAVRLALISVRDVPRMMKQAEDDNQHALKQKPPDYKAISDGAQQAMSALSELLSRVTEDFKHFKDDKAVPAAIRQYMADSIPTYQDIKKKADDLIARGKGLGELKLDTLRDALKQKNSILIRGQKEWRVIPYEKVWKSDAHDARRAGDAAPKPRFAGEQMITTAILALNQPAKTKVCFVRAGGAPLADTGGRFSSIADRLRDYNFDVSEKDLSGTYAMQAMQQQQQAPPEPSDQEIEDAVWVVDGIPGQSNPMMGGPPPSIAPRVADHLAKGYHYANGQKVAGGSAFIMFIPQGDDMIAALSPFGISARVNAMLVHEPVKAEGAETGDVINSAQRTPFIFTFKHWGDHPITQTLDSLLSILIQAVPIRVDPTPGVTSSPLIPVPGAPSNPPCWGETDLQSVQGTPKFDDKTDLAPPLFAGAAAEKSGQRVVCLGCEPMLMGADVETQSLNLVDYPVQEVLERSGVYVPQFPGSGEFFMNSLFWLSHQETMIAISPAAMNVSRIADMSKGVQTFWQMLIMIGLPSVVLVIGGLVFYVRQN